MKRFLMLLSAASLLVVVSGASFAQFGSGEITPPEKGTAEVSLGLNAQLMSPSDISLQLSYAPYLNRNLQVGGQLSYYRADGSGSDPDYTQWGLGATATYNFVAPEGPVSRMIPYAGIGLGYVKADAGDWDDDATMWTVFGGVKQFISEDVALYGQLAWSKASEEIYRDGEKDELRLMVGLSTYLKMGKAE
ncbi:MAG TPA: hypothetical protein PKK84_07735 [Armatimonadota bacterium]|jgi:opacity protein-like surface antigen|nr:hypothetical protein [Armatimonadota bacterium]